MVSDFSLMSGERAVDRSLVIAGVTESSEREEVGEGVRLGSTARRPLWGE